MLGKVLFFSLSLATGAGAADLLRPSFTPSESEQSRFRWTGGYIGLHGAYGWSFIETNEVNNITGLSTFGSLRTFGGGGLAG